MNASELPLTFADDPTQVPDNETLIVRVPRAARGKQKLLGALAYSLRFPNYFGWNWDALEECLRDLSWLDGIKRVVIIHEGLPLPTGGGQWTTYLNLLIDVINSRAENSECPQIEVIFPESARAAAIRALAGS
jgi:hypothetical protein